MDAGQFIAALPDLDDIVRGNDDFEQEVLLKVFRKRHVIRDIERYARPTAKRVVTDAEMRRQAEDHRRRSFVASGRCFPETVSPLDALIDAEDRERLLKALPLLSRRQRESVEFEIATSQQSWGAKVKPLGGSHRVNLFKAVKRLKGYFAEDDARRVRGGSHSEPFRVLPSRVTRDVPSPIGRPSGSIERNGGQHGEGKVRQRP